ncbi:MAG: metalloregulator ArsR/SmtB family transcription factor [Candidatus Methylarchaceae archaeon HK01B]|nr:metalloregulator ArsR/SmtB family transcription factor [Candidatus Methylarchaceae archaeon HK01M]MCP8318327.1 metalloregulator ArsR/SmtB family transcription factor [Candidatus Methylarchaceae archaeon HK01B]
MSKIIEARLKRLISSEICEADNIEEYASELKNLALSVGEEDYFKAKERFFKALSDSTRLRIVKMLAKKEMCVCEVMVALSLTQTNASHHLNILERERIIKKRRKGKWVLYRLNMPETLELIDSFSVQK